MGYPFANPYGCKFAVIFEGEGDQVRIAVCLGVDMVVEALKQGSGVHDFQLPYFSLPSFNNNLCPGFCGYLQVGLSFHRWTGSCYPALD